MCEVRLALTLLQNSTNCSVSHAPSEVKDFRERESNEKEENQSLVCHF